MYISAHGKSQKQQKPITKIIRWLLLVETKIEEDKTNDIISRSFEHNHTAMKERDKTKNEAYADNGNDT